MRVGATIELFALSPDGQPSEPLVLSSTGIDPGCWRPSSTVIDLDRDGREDLVVSGCGSTRIHLKEGGRYALRDSQSWPGDFLCAGDFDADGWLDLVLARPFTDAEGDEARALLVLPGSGTGMFGRPRSTALLIQRSPRSSGVAKDLDGDGDADLIVYSAKRVYRDETDTLIVFRNDRDALREWSRLTLASPSSVSMWGSQLTLADLDGNRMDDLLVLRGNGSDNMAVTAVLVKASRLVEGSTIGSLGEAPDNFEVADFNLDGMADFVLASTRSGYGSHAVVYYGHGDGRFTAEEKPTSYGGAGYVVVGDVNHDRLPDIFYSRSQYSGVPMTQVLLNGTVRDEPTVLSSNVPSPPRPSHRIAIDGMNPNPTAGESSVRFSLSGSAPCRLELFDVAGRRVHGQDVVAPRPGPQTVRLAPRRTLSQGLYLLRVTQGHETAVTRLTIIR
jgi:hypothetical protein